MWMHTLSLTVLATPQPKILYQPLYVHANTDLHPLQRKDAILFSKVPNFK